MGTPRSPFIIDDETLETLIPPEMKAFQDDLKRTGDELMRDFMIEQESIVRRILGQWVSEAEPCLIMQRRNDSISGWKIIGLGVVDDPTVTIVVAAL